MDLNAAHVSYVIAAYALSALCFAGLAVAVLRRDRALRHRLDQDKRP